MKTLGKMIEIKPFKKTDDQMTATDLLVSPAKHIMLYGGSRSGKTFLLVYAIFFRAMKCRSKHAILRYRFNHAKQSLVYGTIPDVFKVCFSQLGSSESYLNRTDWFYRLPNGSEVWIGGLDDKHRTEKILGNEYSTIYYNECSQIPYVSVIIARTRLAEKNELTNKFYYDENPPLRSHWTYKEFIENLNPVDKTPLDSADFTSMLMNPEGNKQNLDDEYLKLLNNLPQNEKNRFLLGLWGAALQGAIYGREMQQAVEDKRITKVPYDPDGIVNVWLDLGFNDSTAMWFEQTIGREVRLIHYYENNMENINHYAKYIKDTGYLIGDIMLPHDGSKTELSTGNSVDKQLRGLGFKVIVLPRTKSVVGDLHVVRNFIQRCVFDRMGCQHGIEALESYRREYDPEKGIYNDNPVHDWTSHAADAFRGLAIHHNIKKPARQHRKVNTKWIV